MCNLTAQCVYHGELIFTIRPISWYYQITVSCHHQCRC